MCGWYVVYMYVCVNGLFFLIATGKSSSLSVTKPSSLLKIIDRIVPEFCAIKKVKGRKDPMKTKKNMKMTVMMF